MKAIRIAAETAAITRLGAGSARHRASLRDLPPGRTKNKDQLEHYDRAQQKGGRHHRYASDHGATAGVTGAATCELTRAAATSSVKMTMS
jgi:hypothetical protein